MQFKYQASTAQGSVVTGLLEADTEETAEQMLWDAGLTIVNLKKNIKLPQLHQMLPSVFGVQRKDVIAFSRNMASLLDAGIPLMRGLSILSRHAKPAFKDVVEAIIKDLEEGSRFSDACAKYPSTFPNFYVFLLRTGEEVGNLNIVMKEVSAYMEKDQATASKVKKSLAYPAFVVVLAIAAVIIMLGVVIPQLTGMFTEYGKELPATTQIMVTAGDFFEANLTSIIGGSIAVVVLVSLYVRTKRGKRDKDRLMLKLPVLGPAILKSSLSRFTRNMSMLVGAGVSLYEALQLSVETSTNVKMAESLEQVRTGVGEGLLFSEAMLADSLFPSLMAEMVGIGEETGNLENQLNRVTIYYEEEADEAIGRVTGVLTPALTVGVGLLIGFIAVSIFSSIYGMSSIVE